MTWRARSPARSWAMRSNAFWLLRFRNDRTHLGSLLVVWAMRSIVCPWHWSLTHCFFNESSLFMIHRRKHILRSIYEPLPCKRHEPQRVWRNNLNESIVFLLQFLQPIFHYSDKKKLL